MNKYKSSHKSLILFVILILLTSSFLVYGQNANQFDSINVRVFNKSKYYLKEYTVKSEGKEYTFNDIKCKRYSEYQKLPYLYPFNASKIQIVIKRFLNSSKVQTTTTEPIDHVGDKQLFNGKYTIFVSVIREKNNKKIHEYLKGSSKNSFF